MKKIYSYHGIAKLRTVFLWTMVLMYCNISIDSTHNPAIDTKQNTYDTIVEWVLEYMMGHEEETIPESSEQEQQSTQLFHKIAICPERLLIISYPVELSSEGKAYGIYKPQIFKSLIFPPLLRPPQSVC